MTEKLMHDKLVRAGFRVHLQVLGRSVDGVNARVLIKRGWFPVASSTASSVSQAFYDAYQLAMTPSTRPRGTPFAPKPLD